ncbi:MAG TPA: hypothetical protein VGN12_17045 [Pirellulales bacterium]|jgi:hypothetical protein
MTLATQAKQETTEQGSSTNSKQKLYVVAFASLGLLITVQFRNLFPPRPEATSTAQQTTAPESQENTSTDDSTVK